MPPPRHFAIASDSAAAGFALFAVIFTTLALPTVASHTLRSFAIVITPDGARAAGAMPFREVAVILFREMPYAFERYAPLLLTLLPRSAVFAITRDSIRCLRRHC